MVGAKSNKAFYFVKFENDNLLFLDPHTVQVIL